MEAGRPLVDILTDEDTKNVLYYPNVSNADIERLATALAAYHAGAIKLPNTAREEQKLASKLMKKPFELPASLEPDAKAAEKAAKKEKGQQLGKEIAIARKNGAKAPAAEDAKEPELATA